MATARQPQHEKGIAVDDSWLASGMHGERQARATSCVSPQRAKRPTTHCLPASAGVCLPVVSTFPGGPQTRQGLSQPSRSSPQHDRHGRLPAVAGSIRRLVACC